MLKKNMKSLFIPCLILLICFSCKKDNYIKIGFVAGLSGRRSELGVLSRNSVIFAIDQINSQGGIKGKKIKLIIKDNESDPKTCARVIGELIDEKVPVIIGPLLSQMARPTLDTIKDKNVLVISPTISTDAIKDIDDNFIRVISVASQQAIIIANRAKFDRSKNMAVVYDLNNRAYSEPIYLLFKKLYEQTGGKIVFVGNLGTGESTDFLSLAKKIKRSGADGLFIITSGIDAASLCQQQYKISGNRIKLYGSMWVRTHDIVSQGGRSVEGMMVASNYQPEEVSDKFQFFEKEYEKRFEKKPDFVSVLSYESVLVLQIALTKSDYFDSNKIKESIIKHKNFQGIHEQFTINQYGDAIRKYTLLKIKKGSFEIIKDFE